MKTYLFIGGTADGSRIQTDGRPIIPLHVAPGVSMLFQGAADKFGCDFKTENYRLQRALGGEEIYLYDKIPSSEALELLIAGYTKQP